MQISSTSHTGIHPLALSWTSAGCLSADLSSVLFRIRALCRDFNQARSKIYGRKFPIVQAKAGLMYQRLDALTSRTRGCRPTLFSSFLAPLPRTQAGRS